MHGRMHVQINSPKETFDAEQGEVWECNLPNGRPPGAGEALRFDHQLADGRAGWHQCAFSDFLGSRHSIEKGRNRIVHGLFARIGTIDLALWKH